jgi:hypothetical protein
MKILSWNYRGICNASTVSALRASIKAHHPSLVFLSETMASEKRISKVALLLGFTNFLCVDARGKSGGLCMLWSPNFQISVVEFGHNLIFMKVLDGVSCWNLVGFYGPPHRSKRLKAWVDLHALLVSLEEPWIVLGNFNVVLEDSEKEGGRCGGSSAPNFLKDLLFDIGAVDLGFVGNRFTWSNKRWGRGSIRERLDRGIASLEWRMAFPRAIIYRLGAISSDHCPLLLDSNPLAYFSPRPFRFEAAWARDPRCTEVIGEAWKRNFNGCLSFKLCRKQYNTKLTLKKWNKSTFGLCQSRISELTRNIEDIQCKEVNQSNAKREAFLQSELNEWLIRYDILWKQKSHELWLRNGDRNTKFFHLSTIIRRRHNSIDAIRADDGKWIIDQKAIENHLRDKFKLLFSEEEVSFPPNLDNLLSPILTAEENSELCRIPSSKEVRRVIFDMQSLKAPGPDGLPPLFYKQYWHIVGHSVVSAIQNFFTGGKLLKDLNSTHIVLIPKIPNPTSVNHYRPISLCNVVYKAITKLIVEKLRPLLDKIISPCQSAFVPGRWIGENQVVVKELMHSFKTQKVKGGFVAIKVDLQKAYDRINWNFLRSVLIQLGFPSIFIDWIMECVTTVSSSVLVNGGKTKHFWPTRGLRQGDPLSPYLFILCQEVLSRLIERNFAKGNFSGVKMNVSGLAITHVMFADDLMLFAKANRREVEIINECIDTYCMWSGQKINREKSGLIFSKLVHNDMKR